MRLPSVLRALRPKPREVDPHASIRVTLGDDPHRAVYGSEPQGSWTPPAPHADRRVSLGDDVHHTLYKAPERAPSIAEQIDAMINKHR